MWSNDAVRANVRCPCHYPDNFLKPCSQSVRAGTDGGGEGGGGRVNGSVRSPWKANPKQTKNKKLSSSSQWSAGGVTAEAGRSPSLWPRCFFLSLFFCLSLPLSFSPSLPSGDACFFFISAFQSVLLIHKPSRNVQEWKQRSALPCACSISVPPVLFFLFVCFFFLLFSGVWGITPGHAWTVAKEGQKSQLQASSRRRLREWVWLRRSGG